MRGYLSNITLCREKVRKLEAEKGTLQKALECQRDNLVEDMEELHKSLMDKGVHPHSNNYYLILQCRLQSIQQVI